MLGTIVLLIGIFLITDEYNFRFKPYNIPYMLALLLFMIGIGFGFNGYGINPARDLGPRIFCLFLYGGYSFSNYNYYFWIPIIAPIFGGICGASLYTVLIAW